MIKIQSRMFMLGLLIAAAVGVILAPSARHANASLLDDAENAVEKAGGDISNAAKKAGSDISDETDRFNKRLTGSPPPPPQLPTPKNEEPPYCSVHRDDCHFEDVPFVGHILVRNQPCFDCTLQPPVQHPIGGSTSSPQAQIPASGVLREKENPCDDLKPGQSITLPNGDICGRVIDCSDPDFSGDDICKQQQEQSSSTPDNDGNNDNNVSVANGDGDSHDTKTGNITVKHGRHGRHSNVNVANGNGDNHDTTTGDIIVGGDDNTTTSKTKTNQIGIGHGDPDFRCVIDCDGETRAPTQDTNTDGSVDNNVNVANGDGDNHDTTTGDIIINGEGQNDDNDNANIANGDGENRTTTTGDITVGGEADLSGDD